MQKTLYQILLLILITLTAYSQDCLNVEKVRLIDSMVVNESKKGNAALLVDEQALAGDPLRVSGGAASSYWFPGWQATDHPASAYIDLGKLRKLTNIYLRDVTDQGNFVVEIGAPGDWKPLFTEESKSYNKWNGHQVDVISRYVRFTRQTAGANISEVVIYECPDTQAPSKPVISLFKSTSTSITLKWPASTDNLEVAGYDVYMGGTKVNTSTIVNPAYRITGLSPETSYSFTVKAKDVAGNVSPSSNVLTVSTIPVNFPQHARIAITEDMVINELGVRDVRGDFTKLFDEQDSISTGEPVNNPITHWRVGGDAFFYPATLIVDLGREYEISDIFWFDGPPSDSTEYDVEVRGGKIGIETGTPFNWNLLHETTLANDSLWYRHTATVRTRYLHIKKYSTATYMWNKTGPYIADAPLMEMVIFGKPVGPLPEPPVNQHAPLNMTVDKFMGGNAWFASDTSFFKAVGHVRIYHDMKQGGSLRITDPIDMSWKTDALYERNLTASYESFPCRQKNADGSLNKPNYGGNTLDPESYRVHADNLWQWTARYGHNTNLNLSDIRVLSYQTPKVGLGYINYIENWNEPNATWNKAGAFFTPYEFAAMSSADYDGHLGIMGTKVGVKNADPTMKFAMGGLAGADLDFVKAMKLWSDANRGGSFPSDVLNFHHYTNDPITQKGISPEAGNLLPILQNLVEYRNHYFPGKEVWLSEFGWDVNGGSKQQAIGHQLYGNPGYTAEDLQAMWIVRGFLIGARAGLDRMHLYTLIDAGGYNTYMTSGLVTYNTASSPSAKRKSWYYVSTMKNRLKGMVSVGEYESGNPNVMIYKFKNKTGSNGAYAVWAPTSDGTVINDYQLTLAGSATSAKMITMVKGQETGVETSLNIVGNKVTIKVGENPVFIEVNQIDGSIPSNPNARVNVAEEKIRGSNENEKVSVYPNPANNYLNVSIVGNSPASAQLIDLSGKRKLSKRLNPGSNKIEISNLSKGIYILKVNNGLINYQSKILVE